MIAIDDRGAEMLVSGIVCQAVKDWYCCEGIKKFGYKPDNTWQHTIPDPTAEQSKIERFFQSAWFGILSDLDGHRLLHLMRSGPFYSFRGCGVATGERKNLQQARSWSKLHQYPKLQHELMALNITQAEIAAEIGISPDRLSRWFREGLTDTKVDKIKEALDRIKDSGNRD